MFTKKITTLALAGIMAVTSMGVTSFAAEDSPAIPAEGFKSKGHTLEGFQNAKQMLEEKGLTLEEAKANASNKLAEFAASKGLTEEEAKAKLDAFKASGKTAEGLAEMKANLEAKGISLEEAKANFEGMFNQFAEANGLTAEEAKEKIAQMKENGRTLEGLKNFKDNAGEKVAE